MLQLENCMLFRVTGVHTRESAGSEARIGRQEAGPDFILQVLRQPLNGFDQKHF